MPPSATDDTCGFAVTLIWVFFASASNCGTGNSSMFGVGVF